MINVKQVDFNDIETEWRAMEECGHIPTIFHTYDWLDCWWKILGHTRGQKFIFAVYEDSKLICIAPLFKARSTLRRKIPLFNILRVMGTGESDYNSFIFLKGKEKLALDNLLLYLKKADWDVFSLSNIHEDDLVNSLLPKTLDINQYSFLKEPHISCPYISLPETWEAFYSSLGKSLKKNSRNYLNKLKKLGDIDFVVNENLNDVGIDDFLRLHQNRWDNKSKVLGNSKIKATFHRQVSKALQKYLNICFLTLDTEKIACTYCYDFFGVRYFYLPGMDMKYKKFRLGTIMILNRIEDAIKNGLKEFDFMRGNESYKYHFTKTQRKNMKFVFSQSTIKFKLFKYMEKISQYINGKNKFEQ